MHLAIVSSQPLRDLVDEVARLQEKASQLRQKAERAEQAAEIKLGALLMEVAAQLDGEAR